MNNVKFRKLEADEIEVRIGTINKNGLSLLLYKDARCDMNILDETVGEMNWTRDHYECKGNLYCRVGIRGDDGNFVYKSDCGAETYTEKEKGEASDSFKRACVNWGIGRELYTSPFIWFGSDKCKIEEKNGKPICKDKFVIKKIAINQNKKIYGLQVFNQSAGTAFTYYNAELDDTKKKANKKNEKKEAEQVPVDDMSDQDLFQDLCDESDRMVAEIEAEEHKCSNCGVEINDRVYKYSKTKYDRPLCYDCQKKEGVR